MLQSQRIFIFPLKIECEVHQIVNTLTLNARKYWPTCSRFVFTEHIVGSPRAKLQFCVHINTSSPTFIFLRVTRLEERSLNII